jgi:hypothetical protein
VERTGSGRRNPKQRPRRTAPAPKSCRCQPVPRKRPLEVFETTERQALIPLSRERYDPPRWAEGKVHPDHDISFGKALYSVPTRYIGKSVSIRADSKLVRVYFEGILIKTHPKQPPGA